MNNLAILNNKEVRVTSVQLVDVINKFREEENLSNDKRRSRPMEHKALLRKIRDELESLKTLGINDERNFAPVNYIDSKGESRPCYSLSRDGVLQILNSESALVRYKTIEYINKLEEMS